jgi:hypothetical protein
VPSQIKLDKAINLLPYIRDPFARDIGREPIILTEVFVVFLNPFK